jgi:hypothetical protein
LPDPQEFAVLDEGQRVLSLVGGKALQRVGQPIHHVDRLTLLVSAFGVTSPAGNHGCRQRHVASGGNVLPMTGSSHKGMRSEPFAQSRATVSPVE